MATYSSNDIKVLINKMEQKCASLQKNEQEGFQLALNSFKDEIAALSMQTHSRTQDQEISSTTSTASQSRSIADTGYLILSSDIAETIFDLGPLISKVAVRATDQAILELCGHTSGLLLELSSTLSEEHGAAKELMNTSAFIARKHCEMKIPNFTWEFGKCGFNI